ncbi:oxygenase MpaB family protein [Nonomuraea fuscirosea]|uniref:oxygenase MpaB family protein n=1 Tax=Nonomuraea fuscirosea TaxID=1291556 RepID=UPI0033DF4152
MKATVTPGGGLFGPQSITWRVHTETPAWPAALRAFQLQALHPRTIRGIAQNCLLDDPEVAHARLRHHLDLLAVRTFGTREQAEHAYERVRGLRARLRGLDPGTGTLFRLDEQENLRWAHCAEVSSHLEVARRSGVRLSAAERDAYVAEQRRVALLAGLADAPGDTAELDACVDALRPGLAATEEARRAVRRSVSPVLPLRLDLLTQPLALLTQPLALLTQPLALLTRPLGFFTEPLALLARPLAIGSLPAAGALAFATLPGWARRMYGCHGGQAADHAAGYAAGTMLKALRAASLALPERLVAPEISAARGLMRAVTEASGADVAA